VIDNRKSLFVESSQAGPIWLGQRTSGTSTLGDYDLIVYKKGAWVLHMLRNMMLDLNTMKEDRFRGMMREFYSSYAGKDASTEDFQHVVEKNIGMDMGWFFKEWIYGTGIPSYKYAWRSDGVPGGKYKVSLRVDQANVPEDFQMYVPVKVDFGDGKMARLRVLVRGSHSEQDLPLLPLEPKKIVFNDLESVLCDVEEVGW
jgi:aminopeptidase N